MLVTIISRHRRTVNRNAIATMTLKSPPLFFNITPTIMLKTPPQTQNIPTPIFSTPQPLSVEKSHHKKNPKTKTIYKFCPEAFQTASGHRIIFPAQKNQNLSANIITDRKMLL